MAGMPVWLSTTLLGLGTVFVGLISLIFIIRLMSFLYGLFAGKSASKAPAPAPTAAPAASAEPIENRQQFVAAVSAAIATVMGTEVSGLRITSIKKVK